MEITYELPWTHIQKGTVIGLNETPYVQGAGEPLWKILKIDNHGHAEIIPYNTITPAWWINSDPTAASFGTTMKPPHSTGSLIKNYKYKNGPNWIPLYWYDTPISVWSDAAIWENLLANAPYYNCLDVVIMHPQKAYPNVSIYYLDGTTAVDHNLQVVQRTPSGRNNYYQYYESIDSLNNDWQPPVPTFHWRPFTVGDLISYTNHYHMNANDYADLYKGGIDTIYTGDATGSLHESVFSYRKLPTPGTDDNWTSASWGSYNPVDNAPITPILKIDLSKYHNWHIVKD